MMLLLLLHYSWMLLLLSLRRRKRRWSVILACPQLIGDELPHYFARQVFDHGLVHDAVVLDDGRHGAVLALVTARGLRAAEGRAGSFFPRPGAPKNFLEVIRSSFWAQNQPDRLVR